MDTAVPTRTARAINTRTSGQLAPGLLLAIAVASIATVSGHLVPVVGAPVFAIVGGVVLSSRWTPRAVALPGLKFATKYVLQAAVVVFGLELSFRQVLSSSGNSLPVLFGSLAVALIGASVLGRALGINRDLRTLIGVGTGICGASAIAATNGVIDADKADVSYAIATIFTFNVVAVLTFPALGHWFGLSGHGFGLWAGTAVNDLSSVVAASTIYGHGAITTAVVVKLTRTLMIIPISAALAFARARHRVVATQPLDATTHHRVIQSLPWFIGWFLVAVAIKSLGLVPHEFAGALSAIAQFLIAIALAAIGLSANVRDIRTAGLKPLGLGALLWMLVTVASLGLQHLT